MERINSLNFVPNGAGPGKNGFRDADRANGVQGTQLNALWCGNVQEEIAGLVEHAGLTLDGGNFGQLLQAVLMSLRPQQAEFGPGNQQWQVPANVYWADVYLTGAGGGGGGGSSTVGGGGGGAGATIIVRGFQTIPGTVLTFPVGAPGAGAGEPGTGGNGGNTQFGNSIAAGGYGGSAANPYSSGGAGGTPGGNGLWLVGGSGGDGVITGANFVGGNGGTSYWGGGGRAHSSLGVDGTGRAFGSGGGGGYGAAGVPGGDGAGGCVVIRWVAP